MEKREITLSQSNLLTQARYDFTKVEKRAVYFIIQEIRRQFIDKTDGQKTLFENLVIQMDTAKLQGTETQLREVYLSLKSLRRKSIWIEDDERVLEVGYINYFEHVKRSSSLEVEVSNKILPYLVKLAREFTTYSLTVAIALKTKYSQRFYEYCSQFKSTGFMYIKVEELRKQMMIEDKYKMYAAFKSKVLDSAQTELEELYKKGECDLYFTYTEDRAGRTVRGFKIYVHTKEAELAKSELKPQDMIYYIRTSLESWLAAKRKPKNQEWVNRVIKHLQLNADNIKPLYDRLEKMRRKESPDSYGAYARHIIEEDYLNETTLKPKPRKSTKQKDSVKETHEIEVQEAEDVPLTEEEEKQALKDIEKLKNEL
jgi:plasmid replication initiation protein